MDADLLISMPFTCAAPDDPSLCGRVLADPGLIHDGAVALFIIKLLCRTDICSYQIDEPDAAIIDARW